MYRRHHALPAQITAGNLVVRVATGSGWDGEIPVVIGRVAAGPGCSRLRAVPLSARFSVPHHHLTRKDSSATQTPSRPGIFAAFTSVTRTVNRTIRSPFGELPQISLSMVLLIHGIPQNLVCMSLFLWHDKPGCLCNS